MFEGYLGVMHSDLRPFFSIATPEDIGLFMIAQMNQTLELPLPDLTPMASAMLMFHNEQQERMRKSKEKRSSAAKKPEQAEATPEYEETEEEQCPSDAIAIPEQCHPPVPLPSPLPSPLPNPSPNSNESTLAPSSASSQDCEQADAVSPPRLFAVASPQSSAVMYLELNDGSQWPVTDELLEKWGSLYPATDVVGELKKMVGWLMGNPKRRKTKKGVMAFVTNWLSRAQDRTRASPQTEARKGKPNIGLQEGETKEEMRKRYSALVE